MAASRRSSKRKIPVRLKATNTIGLGIINSALGSATMTQTATRRNSLRRAGSKIPSLEANRVRFAEATEGTGKTQYPRTPGLPRQTTTQASKTRTTRSSLSMQFSPRTAKKAADAAKVVQEQTALIDEKLDSPPPVSSKIVASNFRGTGFRAGTGRPPTPERRSDGKTATRTGLWTPPETAKTNRTRGPTTTMHEGSPPRERVITITPETATTQRQIYIDGVSDWLSFPSPPTQRFDPSSPPIEIPTSALLSHMATLKTTPRALALEELHLQFYLLQKMLRQFTKRHFRARWSDDRISSFPLADLATLPETQPFFRIASYLADGSTYQTGWTSFLTSEHTRPHLAYAILSEWLRYNVFGHSCFGLSAEEDQLMTDIDIKYLHWDGFVRTKERAKLLRRILETKLAWEVEMDTAAAVKGVVSDLLKVLGPILPSEKSQLAELTTQLTGLVEVAANLHQCIRLTGMDGTIIRFQGSTKGDPFAYTARQNCVNKATVTRTVDDMIEARKNAAADATAKPPSPAPPLAPRTRDKLLIKLPCFPHVMATVPFGPTLRDYAVEQSLYESTIRSEDLPPLASAGDGGPQYIEDIPCEIVRAGCMEALPESCHREYGRRLGAGEKRKTAYGSYVKSYTLNESDVYCEWEFEGEVIEGKGMTLRQAVEGAEREAYGFVRRERSERNARIAVYVAGTVAGIMAAGTVAAVGYGLYKNIPLGAAAVSAIKNLKSLERLSVEDVKGAVRSAMKAADTRTKPFRKAAKQSFRITKDYASKYTTGSLAAVKSQLGSAQARAKQLAPGTGPIPNLASSAVSKASDLSHAAASVVKDAVMGEVTPEARTAPGLLSGILEPISVGLHETPIKAGIELGRVAGPTAK